MILDRPLSYWVAVARLGFQDDLNRLVDDLGISQAELARRITVSEAYVSKFLNGVAGNYELQTMAKWARAVGGIVQVRVIKGEGEVVRVVDYDTARLLDEKEAAKALPGKDTASDALSNIVVFPGTRVVFARPVEEETTEAAINA